MRLNKTKVLNDMCSNKTDDVSISSSSSSSSSSTIMSPQQPNTVRVSKFLPIQPPTAFFQQAQPYPEFAPRQEAPQRVDLNKTIRQPLRARHTNYTNLLNQNQPQQQAEKSTIYTSFNYQGLFRQENLLQISNNFLTSFQPSLPGRPIFKSK
jgi:hypothetical protein